MRVRLLVNLNHRGEVLSAGSVVTLPAELAELLVAGGSAELFEPPSLNELSVPLGSGKDEPNPDEGSSDQVNSESDSTDAKGASDPDAEQPGDSNPEQPESEPDQAPKTKKGKTKKEG